MVEKRRRRRRAHPPPPPAPHPTPHLAPPALQLPPGQLPTYETANTHLRGVDTELLDRVAAEFAAAFGAGLAEAGLAPPRDFGAGMRQKLRVVWDRTSGDLKKGFELEPAAGAVSNVAGRRRKSAAGPPSASTAAAASASAATVSASAAAEGEEEGEGGGTVEEEPGEPGGGSDGEGASQPAKRPRSAAPSSAGGGAATAAKGPKLEPFEVPEGFGRGDLPAVELHRPAAARRSLQAAAVERFLQLRAEVGAGRGGAGWGAGGLHPARGEE